MSTMAAIWRLLGYPSRTSPPPLETDDIYPTHMLDNADAIRDIVVVWTLRFNDVLDAGKLHGSLTRLLEIGDWRKLGGRLRVRADKKLEIHVPQAFTAERPAISYSHETILLNIDEHPLASTLPKATEGPSIQRGSADFQTLGARKDTPATLDDFIYSDTPQISLHITSFNDATLVGLSFPHTLMDAMSQRALLQAWSLVLAKKESKVPPLLGAKEDAICAAIEAETDETKQVFKLERMRLRGWSMFTFALRFAWAIFWNPTVETKTIFLPREAISALKHQAQQDIPLTDQQLLSINDVLGAWVVHAIATSLPQPRPVTLLNAVNARARLPSLSQSPGVYIQNMVLAAFTFLSPADTTTDSLGSIALKNRQHLTTQLTAPQVFATLRELNTEARKSGNPQVLCGESDALLVPFTNWTHAAIIHAADFGPAVVRVGEVSGQSRRNPAGTMVFHHASAMRQSPFVRNVLVVFGRDFGGGYWLSGSFLPATWRKVEEEMERLAVKTRE
ncbi:hypothetical protein BJX70DRAFT_368081 [Aspergillus crustosus]